MWPKARLSQYLRLGTPSCEHSLYVLIEAAILITKVKRVSPTMGSPIPQLMTPGIAEWSTHSQL